MACYIISIGKHSVKLLDAEGAAKALKLKISTVRGQMRKGKIKNMQFGWPRITTDFWLQEYANNRQGKPGLTNKVKAVKA